MFLNATRVDAKYCIDTCYQGLLKPISVVYEKALIDSKAIAPFLSLARKLQREYISNTIPPDYFIDIQKTILNERPLHGLLRVFKASIFGFKKIANLDLYFLDVARLFYLNKIQWRRKFFPTKIFSSIPENKKYVYFPLQVDPESSTMVISPMHTDQLSVIESLAKSLPADMILVVKEHLPMLGCRKLEFYRRIMEMPRVVLVNPFQVVRISSKMLH